MPQLTSQQMWASYIQALSQISGVPDFNDLILTGVTMPATLNIATQAVLPVTPLGQALAQIYQLGNTLPKWAPFYAPTESTVFGQYEMFVAGIKLQGSIDPAVQAAIQADRNQVAAAYAQYNKDYSAAYADYTDKNTKQPGLYASFTDFISKSPWNATLQQDVLAQTGAQSRLNTDMVRAYGSAYAPVQNAQTLIQTTHSQMLLGPGSLTMNIAPDSGNEVVPKFDPGALGNPGFSAWLDQAVTAAGQGAPPQFSASINASSTQYDLSKMTFFQEGGGLAELFDFFWASAEGSEKRSSVSVNSAASEFGITVTAQSVTYLPINPGPWYEGSLLSQFQAATDFYPDSPFAKNPIWGPSGIFNVIPKGLILAFRPLVTATFDASTYSKLKTDYSRQISGAFGIGPFFVGEYSQSKTESGLHIATSDNNNSITLGDALSTAPVILGIIADHPNR